MSSRSLRSDLAFIADWVRPETQVLDLGCGDGRLLAYLQNHKGCRCVGVEIDPEKLRQAAEAGVEVLQLDLEAGLSMFDSASFDTILQLESLQMVRHTRDMLSEIARVGREAIVTFPNFAYWRHRLAIVRGRMPVTRSLPYQWYDTPNLRFSTPEDFAELAAQCGLRVAQAMALHGGQPVRWLPRLRGSLAVFRLIPAAQSVASPGMQ